MPTPVTPRNITSDVPQFTIPIDKNIPIYSRIKKAVHRIDALMRLQFDIKWLWNLPLAKSLPEEFCRTYKDLPDISQKDRKRPKKERQTSKSRSIGTSSSLQISTPCQEMHPCSSYLMRNVCKIIVF